MGSVILRPARRGDAGRMASVYAPYVQGTTVSWETRVPGRVEMARRLDQHLAAGFPWLAAELDGALLGYAYAGRLAERDGYAWDAEVSIYLAADAHRHRVGKALYAALLALLAQQGYCNCYALITHPNPGSAAFHQAMGFREIARLPGAGYKLGQWVWLSYFFVPLRPLPAQPLPPVPFSALDPQLVQDYLARAGAMIRPF